MLEKQFYWFIHTLVRNYDSYVSTVYFRWVFIVKFERQSLDRNDGYKF